MAHRCITLDAMQRREGLEKITRANMWVFHCALDPDVHISVPYLIANYFLNASGLRGGSTMCGGKFITKLARSFRLIIPRNTSNLCLFDNAIETDPSYYVKSKLAMKSIGRYYLSPVQPAAAIPEEEPEAQQEQPPPPPPAQFNFGSGPYPWDSQFENMTNAFSQFGISQNQINENLERNYGLLQEQNSLLRQNLYNQDYFGSIYNQQSQEIGRYLHDSRAAIHSIFDYLPEQAQEYRPPMPDPYSYYLYAPLSEREHMWQQMQEQQQRQHMERDDEDDDE